MAQRTRTQEPLLVVVTSFLDLRLLGPHAAHHVKQLLVHGPSSSVAQSTSSIRVARRWSHLWPFWPRAQRCRMAEATGVSPLHLEADLAPGACTKGASVLQARDWGTFIATKYKHWARTEIKFLQKRALTDSRPHRGKRKKAPRWTTLWARSHVSYSSLVWLFLTANDFATGLELLRIASMNGSMRISC